MRDLEKEADEAAIKLAADLDKMNEEYNAKLATAGEPPVTPILTGEQLHARLKAAFLQFLCRRFPLEKDDDDTKKHA